MALTFVGVFGIVHHDAARRTREMGIRISLGADARRILALVLSRALGPALLGMAAGVGVSLWWTGAPHPCRNQLAQGLCLESSIALLNAVDFA